MIISFILMLSLRLTTTAQEGVNTSRHLRPFDLWEGNKPGAVVQSNEVEALSNWSCEWSVTTTLKSLEAKEAQIELIQTHDPKMARVAKTINNRVRNIARDPFAADPLFNAASTKTESLPDEQVLVGDRKYQCHVTRFEEWRSAFNPGIKVGHMLKIWYSGEVPGRIVKAEGLEVSGGDRATSRVEITAKLTSLDEKVTIREKVVPCVLLEIKALGKHSFPGMNPPSESTTEAVDKIWLSNEVPGKVVRMASVDRAKSFNVTILDFSDGK